MEKKDDLKNSNHIKKICVQKASNLLKISIGVSIFVFIKCIYNIICEFYLADINIALTIFNSFIILLAFVSLKLNNILFAKITSFIGVISSTILVAFSLYVSLDYHDLVFCILVILMFKTFTSLRKADGTNDSVDYADNFYDSL